MAFKKCLFAGRKQAVVAAAAARHGTAAAAVGGTRVISRRPDLKKAESNVAQVHKKKEKEEKITRRTF